MDEVTWWIFTWFCFFQKNSKHEDDSALDNHCYSCRLLAHFLNLGIWGSMSMETLQRSINFSAVISKTWDHWTENRYNVTKYLEFYIYHGWRISILLQNVLYSCIFPEQRKYMIPVIFMWITVILIALGKVEAGGCFGKCLRDKIFLRNSSSGSPKLPFSFIDYHFLSSMNEAKASFGSGKNSYPNYYKAALEPIEFQSYSTVIEMVHRTDCLTK